MSNQGVKEPGRFAVFRNRNFALLYSGSIVSNAGSWMQLVAQGWLAYQLSGSPLMLGLIGVSRGLPIIFIAPFGGVIADRVDRVKLLKVTQSISLLLALVPAVLVTLEMIQIWHLLVISFTGSAINAFDNPTRQALLPDLVRKEDLSKAIALNASAWNGAALFGPALAGITIATIGAEGAFYANSASFVAVLIALHMLKGIPQRKPSGPQKSVGRDFVSGISYARTTPFIFTMLILASIISIFGRSYQHLLPVFAEDVLNGGSTGLGLMLSAPGAGTLVGAAAIAGLKDVKHKGLSFVCGMLVFSVVVIAFSLNRSFPVALVLLFISGFAQLTFSTMMSTMMQIEVPPEMRGRIMALQAVSFQGFHPLGAIVTGTTATLVGTPAAVGLSAVVVASAAVITLLFIPRVRDYMDDRGSPMQPPSATPIAVPGGGRAGAPASVSLQETPGG